MGEEKYRTLHYPLHLLFHKIYDVKLNIDEPLSKTRVYKAHYPAR